MDYLKVGKGLSLAGTIIETVMWGIMVFTIIGTIPAAYLISMSWVARNQIMNGSKGWNVYMLVQSAVVSIIFILLFSSIFNLVSLLMIFGIVGYSMILLDK